MSAKDRLTPAQRATVDFYKAYGVHATWFEGAPLTDGGTVEVIALGDGFIWSLGIAPDGEAATSEATVGDFETGIEV